MNTDPDVRQKAGWLIVAALLTALSIFLGVNFPVPPPPADLREAPVELGTTHFAAVQAEDLTATDDLAVTDDSSFGDAVTVAGATALNGGLAMDSDRFVVADATGDTTVGGRMTLSAGSAITVTNGAAFTPTGTYQPIRSAGTVTPTVTAGAAGQWLVLVNSSNTSIVMDDSGTQKLAGKITLGQYDTLTLWCDGTNWVQVATADN